MLSSSEIKFTRRPREIVFVPPRTYCEAEVDVEREQGYQNGLRAAWVAYEEKLAGYQEEMLDSQRQIFNGITAHHDTLVEQFSRMLPGVVMEAVSRVLAVVEYDKALITGIVAELLGEIRADSGELEVMLSARDLKLFEGNEQMFRQKYPGIRFIADADLRPGDCMVQSRFGTFDGRIATKVENVEALLQ